MRIFGTFCQKSGCSAYRDSHLVLRSARLRCVFISVAAQCSLFRRPCFPGDLRSPWDNFQSTLTTLKSLSLYQPGAVWGLHSHHHLPFTTGHSALAYLFSFSALYRSVVSSRRFHKAQMGKAGGNCSQHCHDHVGTGHGPCPPVTAPPPRNQSHTTVPMHLYCISD